MTRTGCAGPSPRARAGPDAVADGHAADQAPVQALVLTVSDGKGFAQTGGIIELFIEDGRMRFAINLDAMEQTGVRLSSRLLGLAKVVRNPHDQ